MSQSASLPSVVIVGRPNVGKSTLFNAILGKRRAIVGDEPGITRDRIVGEAVYRGRRFELIDTGGLLPDDDELIPSEIFKQARVALADAAHVIFLVDGRAEITASDRELVRLLRRLGKPMTLAVNKIDTAQRADLVHEFHSLGLGDMIGVSAEHRLGIDELLDHVTSEFGQGNAEATKAPEIRIAIIGRPNVGKSTLLNALAGKERTIVSPVAGTTRDSVDEIITHSGRRYTFVDTAGIRRKGKTKLMAEKLSVVMARKNIDLADVVLIILDATEGILGLDATIAGYAHEEGRAVILCVNKWDAAPKTADGAKGKKKFVEDIRDELKFLDYAPIAFVSAEKKMGTRALFPLIKKSYEAASRRVTTGELNRFVATLSWEYDMKIYYMVQANVRPPTFVVFTDKAGKLHFSAERYLINRLRERFDFTGTPIVIKTKRR